MGVSWPLFYALLLCTIIKMRLIVKPTAAQSQKYELDCEASCKVSELKEMLAAPGQANMPASEQRLIYKGQILKGVCTLLLGCFQSGGAGLRNNMIREDSRSPCPPLPPLLEPTQQADDRSLESYSECCGCGCCAAVGLGCTNLCSVHRSSGPVQRAYPSFHTQISSTTTSST